MYRHRVVVHYLSDLCVCQILELIIPTKTYDYSVALIALLMSGFSDHTTQDSSSTLYSSPTRVHI